MRLPAAGQSRKPKLQNDAAMSQSSVSWYRTSRCAVVSLLMGFEDVDMVNKSGGRQ